LLISLGKSRINIFSLKCLKIKYIAIIMENKKEKGNYNYETHYKYHQKNKDERNAKMLEKYHKNNPKCVCGLRLKSIDHELSSKHNLYLYQEELKKLLGKDDVDEYLHRYMGKYPKLTNKINTSTKNKFKK